jgi:hypothetical protein
MDHGYEGGAQAAEERVIGWGDQQQQTHASLGVACMLSYHRCFHQLAPSCRFPTLPVAELARHTAPVNAIVWAPHTAAHICSAGDDHQALIWDMTSVASGQPPPGAPAAGPGGASNGAAGEQGYCSTATPAPDTASCAATPAVCDCIWLW